MWFLDQDLDMTYREFRDRQAALESEANSDHRITYDRLYGDLGIIDSKVGALAQLVSIEAAIYSGIAASMRSEEWKLSIQTVLLVAGGIAAYVGVVFCLLVIWVTWAGSTLKGTHEEHAERIYKIRLRRTVQYRLGWTLAMLGALLLPAYSAAALFFKL
jgi:hypothetical protein